MIKTCSLIKSLRLSLGILFSNFTVIKKSWLFLVFFLSQKKFECLYRGVLENRFSYIDPPSLWKKIYTINLSVYTVYILYTCIFFSIMKVGLYKKTDFLLTLAYSNLNWLLEFKWFGDGNFKESNDTGLVKLFVGCRIWPSVWLLLPLLKMNGLVVGAIVDVSPWL